MKLDLEDSELILFTHFPYVFSSLRAPEISEMLHFSYPVGSCIDSRTKYAIRLDALKTSHISFKGAKDRSQKLQGVNGREPEKVSRGLSSTVKVYVLRDWKLKIIGQVHILYGGQRIWIFDDKFDMQVIMTRS